MMSKVFPSGATNVLCTQTSGIGGFFRLLVFRGIARGSSYVCIPIGMLFFSPSSCVSPRSPCLHGSSPSFLPAPTCRYLECPFSPQSSGLSGPLQIRMAPRSFRAGVYPLRPMPVPSSLPPVSPGGSARSRDNVKLRTTSRWQLNLVGHVE